MKNLSISILNVENIPVFLDKLKKVESFYEKEKIKDRFNVSIHFDVMDNKFVPNTGIDIEKIAEVNKFKYYIDTHLMVEKPIEDGYIDRAIDLGCRDITIHYEIDNFANTLNYLLEKKKDLKGDLKIGVSVKPNTDVKEIEKYINKIDKVLIMSVEPGFGGQKYIDSVTDKIKYIKNKYPSIFVQVDGGVNEDTLMLPLRENVDSVVVGSYITKHEEKILDRLCILNGILDIETAPHEANLEFEKRTIQAVDGGYAQGDILLGIRVPRIRAIAKKWHKVITFDTLSYFIQSKIHDYRRFAVFCLDLIVNRENYNKVKDFIDNNIEHINNWDLVDSLAPVCIGKQILDKTDDQIYDILREYTKSSNIWTKRIGIVSLLYIAKENRKKVVFDVINDVFYEEFHLYQKANGWVLRELYKVNPKDTLDYLIEKNKVRKIPNILKSYATEKMTKEEKEKIK